MLKIGSCTVLFNPDRDVISNVETYKDLVDVCVVVDNSERKMKYQNILRKILHIFTLICMAIRGLRLH